MEHTETKTNITTDLAVERTELALERTHLAWIRTTFSIMTAGVAIDKGMAYIHEKLVAQDIALVKNAHFIGLFLTSFGTVLLLIETYQYVKRNKQLASIKQGKAPLFTPGLILAILVLILGIVLVQLMLSTG